MGDASPPSSSLPVRYLEEDVESEEGSAGDEREHGRVLVRHRLRLLPRRLTRPDTTDMRLW